MVGMPNGRIFPFALGIKTLRNGRGLYPRRLNLPTASHRLSGVSHSSRSTPAVRLPWFCVTRRIAHTLADNVRVSIRCSAFTLRQLPSCVAFAIRICIPLTFRSTRRQSMAYQLSSAWESADPSLRIDTFMLLSFSKKKFPSRRTKLSPCGSQFRSRKGIQINCRCTAPDDSSSQRVVSRPATVDQTEVCPLSREVMSQPLSEPLQSDIRFFRPPIPAWPTVFLAVHLPETFVPGSHTGLPRSLSVTRLV